MIRILLVGDAGVGKTSVLMRYAEDSFEQQQPDFEAVCPRFVLSE